LLAELTCLSVSFPLVTEDPVFSIEPEYQGYFQYLLVVDAVFPESVLSPAVAVV
jgi:hypothetical protein